MHYACCSLPLWVIFICSRELFQSREFFNCWKNDKIKFETFFTPFLASFSKTLKKSWFFFSISISNQINFNFKLRKIFIQRCKQRSRPEPWRACVYIMPAARPASSYSAHSFCVCVCLFIFSEKRERKKKSCVWKIRASILKVEFSDHVRDVWEEMISRELKKMKNFHLSLFYCYERSFNQEVRNL
jgi:hypothetical protein